jgi:hypothetical protein
MRPKWDEKHFGDGKTYGQSVIEKAVQDTKTFLIVRERRNKGSSPKAKLLPVTAKKQ